MRALNRQKMFLRNLKNTFRRHIANKFSNPGYKKIRSLEPVNLDDYFRQVEINYKSLANPFHYYAELINFLNEKQQFNVVPLSDLLTAEIDERPVVSLRHDIDADPVTAIRCARYLARVGLPGSFYLLHTAPYYGFFHEELFVRTQELSDWVIKLIVTGCEIGVHNDALGLYCNGLDGGQALVDEIEWLRSKGAKITGTVAHNSGPTYGAENSEIFHGRVLWERTVKQHGHKLPLGIVDEASIGITYEGTYTRRKANLDVANASAFFADKSSASATSEFWMKSFLHSNPAMDYLVDYQFWLIGQNKWVVSGPGVYLWNIGIDQVFSVLKKLSRPSRAVIVVHPEYVRG